jgi:hypothetical protein
MDFLYSGVADCTGWVIACSGGEGEGVGDSVKEIDDILRACACALGGGRFGVAKRLRRADEDFRMLFTQVQAHSNRSQPAGLPNLADSRINDVVGVRQLRLRLCYPFSILPAKVTRPESSPQSLWLNLWLTRGSFNPTAADGESGIGDHAIVLAWNVWGRL